MACALSLGQREARARRRGRARRTGGPPRPCSVISSALACRRSGSSSGGTRQVVSPAMPSGSRLVASTCRCGQARSRCADQLARRRRPGARSCRARAARASAAGSRSACGHVAGVEIAQADGGGDGAGTCAGSVSPASSTSQAPSTKSARAARQARAPGAFCQRRRRQPASAAAASLEQLRRARAARRRGRRSWSARAADCAWTAAGLLGDTPPCGAGGRWRRCVDQCSNASRTGPSRPRARTSSATVSRRGMCAPPRSSSLMLRGLTPARSANSSWVRPAARRWSRSSSPNVMDGLSTATLGHSDRLDRPLDGFFVTASPGN